MRRSLRLVFAVLAAAALSFTAAAPAGAQEELGLETNITEGGPGEIVSGQVDTDDIAENCVTDLEDFQARFEEWLNGPFDGDEEGPLFDRIFPGGQIVFENYTQLAWALTGFTAVGIIGNLEGAAEDALPQTFVLTFADIETQEPVGEMGNFDPATGEGIVEVPDIEPGQWAVAAACVGPTADIDAIEAGLQANGAFLQELGVPVDFESAEFIEFLEDFTGETGFNALVAFLQEFGPTLLEPMVTPDALGAVIFCIFDQTGQCPAPPPPPDGDDDDDRVALPVMIQPDFTG
jgi:hypothetical protein